MSVQGNTGINNAKLEFKFAEIIIILLWIIYTIIQTLNLLIFNKDWGKLLGAGLSIIPGILGIFTLYKADMKLDELYLHRAPISKKGFIALAITLLALPPIIFSGQWVGWNWFNGLIDAPISGIAQELFFRSALLPVFIKKFNNRINLAIFLHSIPFGLWHIGVIFLAPWYGAIFVMLIPFLCGLAWGWQVQHDGTIFYLLILHISILIINSMFIFG